MSLDNIYHPCPTPRCRLSDLDKPHKLCRRSDPPLSLCFECKGGPSKKCKYYYYCSTCNLEFHRACRWLQPKLTHPFHQSHPLTPMLVNDNHDEVFDATPVVEELNNRSDDSDIYGENPYDFSFSDSSESEDDDASLSPGDYERCNCCRRRRTDLYYYCSPCDFHLNISCVKKLPPLTITHLKSHDHALTLFPRRLPSPCGACGFSLDTNDFVYTCLPCNYMVHKKCIYLPRVIRLTRHFHRLSLCSSRSSSGISCGVCRKTVDMNHGQYSCSRGCAYSVHSKCATRDDVWDGKDLEGVPEEDDEEKILEPFVRIDEETIQHFSHDQHYLRFYPKKNHRDEKRICEGCCLPMTVSDSFYSCTQCDFVLHEACASLPRKIYHPLHKHPLILFPFPFRPFGKIQSSMYGGIFRCSSCDKDRYGFQYKCGEENCEFEVDVRCASLSDPLIHDIHPHGLFFNLTRGECKGDSKSHYCSKVFLECIECNFFFCLYCATVPRVVHYEHDRHPLALCYGEKEKTNLQYWCEICESKVDSEAWFYTCDSCSVTLHISCLVERNMFLKPNHTVKLKYGDAEMVSNDGNSRPICGFCGLHCPNSFIVKEFGIYYCSLSCSAQKMERKLRESMEWYGD